jgi:benzoyl-CoA reductase/2-hydroxyglutaryl-CoA dehydratase subunit BcrC/BadD/HgdB
VHASILRSRLDHLLSVAKEFEVDGVVLYELKFCDNYHYDAPSSREMLKRSDIPVLELNRNMLPQGTVS